jgi:hypothetical protein
MADTTGQMVADVPTAIGLTSINVKQLFPLCGLLLLLLLLVVVVVVVVVVVFN